MRAVGIGLGVALCVLVFGAIAYADVVGAPPADCPPGSVGTASHAGPYCRPDDCSQDASRCAGSSSCQSKALCIVEIQGGSIGGPSTVRSVVGPCSADGRCGEGTCTKLSVCTSSATGVGGAGPSSSSDNGGCTLHGAGTAASGAAAFAAVGLCAWFVARRRRVGRR